MFGSGCHLEVVTPDNSPMAATRRRIEAQGMDRVLGYRRSGRTIGGEQGGEGIMNALIKHGLRWAGSESGATATEYAVMLALIFLACIGAVSSLGLTLASKFVIPGW